MAFVTRFNKKCESVKVTRGTEDEMKKCNLKEKPKKHSTKEK